MVETIVLGMSAENSEIELVCGSPSGSKVSSEKTLQFETGASDSLLKVIFNITSKAAGAVVCRNCKFSFCASVL